MMERRNGAARRARLSVDSTVPIQKSLGGEPIFKSSTATEHKFEVPYTNDLECVQKYADSPFKDSIKFIYMPGKAVDGQTSVTRTTEIKKDTSTVEERIATCHRYGFEPSILLQRGEHSDEELDWYLDRGVRFFTVGPDKVAERLREMNPDVYLTGSITKDLLLEDYQYYSKEKPDLYNIFVLRFHFSRALEEVKALPKNLKYCIMPNNSCLWNCPWYRKHWFQDTEKEISWWRPNTNCQPLRFGGKDNESGRNIIHHERVMRIPQQDLYLFDPYVDTYKLIDRTEPVEMAVAMLRNYASVSVAPRATSAETLALYNCAVGKARRLIPPIY